MVPGRRLMRADLEKKQIDVLWDCGGCSSPVLISAQRVAVLKQSELWTVGIDGASPRKELSLPDAEALVGITAEPPTRILILARAVGSQRPVRVQPKLVDVATWTIAAAPPDIDMVFNREDAFASFPRPDEYRNGARLKTSAGRPWHVQTERVDTASAVNQPLFAGWPAAPGMSAATQRFDAIWLDDRRVVFLELP
jgi:hypothetical protein